MITTITWILVRNMDLGSQQALWKLPPKQQQYSAYCIHWFIYEYYYSMYKSDPVTFNAPSTIGTRCFVRLQEPIENRVIVSKCNSYMSHGPYEHFVGCEVKIMLTVSGHGYLTCT